MRQVVFILILTISSPLAAENLCAGIFSINERDSAAPFILKLPTRVSEQQNRWRPEFFTDPRAYNENTPFLFLVHGVATVYHSSYSAREVYRHLTSISEKDLFILSASVISDRHTVFYGRAGFIIEVNEKAIVASEAKDMAVDNNPQSAGALKSHLEYLTKSHSLASPDEVANQAAWSRKYNEVAICGTSINNYQIRIKGVVIRASDPFAGRVLPLSIELEYRELAKELGIPIVSLK